MPSNAVRGDNKNNSSNKNKMNKNNNRCSDSIADDASYFYIVDMDLTSEGDMNEEVSHLSDPTASTSPHHAAAIAAIARRFHGQHQNQNHRRMNRLKQPIVALRDRFSFNSYKNSSRHRQQQQEQQQQRHISMKHPYHIQNAAQECEDDQDGTHDNDAEKRKTKADVSPLTMAGPEGIRGKIMTASSSNEPRSLYQVFEKENSPFHQGGGDDEERQGHEHSPLTSSKGNNNNHNSSRKKNYGSTNDGGKNGIFREVHVDDDNDNNNKGGHNLPLSLLSRNQATTVTGPSMAVAAGLQSHTSSYHQSHQHNLSWDDNERLLLFDDERTTTPTSTATDMLGINTNDEKIAGFKTTTTMVAASAAEEELNYSNTSKSTANRPSLLSSISSWWQSSFQTNKNDGTALMQKSNRCSSSSGTANQTGKDYKHGGDSSGTYRRQGISWPPSTSWYPFNNHCRFDNNGNKDRMIKFVNDRFSWIIQHWGYFLLAVSVILYVVVCFDQIVMSSFGADTDRPSSPPTIIIDVLYWSIVSLTTIGGGLNTSRNQYGKDNLNLETSSAVLICTSIFGFLGITTLAVCWGHYNRLLLSKVEAMKKRKQASRVQQVFDAFCNQKTSSLSTLQTSSHNECRLSTKIAGIEPTNQKTNRCAKVTQRALLRSVKQFCVPVLVVVLASIIGTISGWNGSESTYFAIISAFTMTDGVIYPVTMPSKLVAMMMLPFSMALALRWMLSVSNVVSNTDRDVDSTKDSDPVTVEEVSGLLQAARMDDGLLTRADYMELMLLAMKKVDPDILIELRTGFERATLYGSIDMTRKEWIAEAANALDGSFNSQVLKDDSAQPGEGVLHVSTAMHAVSDWLLGIDRLHNTHSGDLPSPQDNYGNASLTSVEV